MPPRPISGSIIPSIRCNRGKAILRGHAYGANIGWISFESTGNPRLRFSDGNFEDYAYSANCGWINLGNGAFVLNTLSVAPGIDTDMDGMADAFEVQFFGNLAMNMNMNMNMNTDTRWRRRWRWRWHE